MFQKVHLHLTILCAGITAAIMLVMSLIYLHLTEKQLYDNQFNSFCSDINTIAANLEQQTVISMQWISKMEAQGNYTFFFSDNGVPFLYNTISSGSSETAQESLEACTQMFPSFMQDNSYSAYLARHVEYEFHSASSNQDYFSSVIVLNRNSSNLQVIILSSLASLDGQLFRQRLRFLLIGVLTSLLLTLFSWIFTGLLLSPIEKNRQQQNRFIAAASHELRTPLSVIIASAECCRNAAPEKQRGFLDTICDEGKRMAELINDMLLLSHSDTCRTVYDIKECELDTLLMNLYEDFGPLAEKEGLLLAIQLPENPVPVCRCDPDAIRQALLILLHNAVSYTPAPGSVLLSLSYEGGQFCLSVSDTGIGIPDSEKEKIFERFYRAEKARSAKGHFGLGLSIACEIVKAHQGTISVLDREGKGSIFLIRLHSL